MRRFILPLLVLALVCTVQRATLDAPVVLAADPVVQHLTFTNQVDPDLSAQISGACGFPVVATVTGVATLITQITSTGAIRELQLQSYTATYTNPATGTSVTLRAALQVQEIVVTSADTRTITLRLQGLNFLFVQPGGASVSAGRRDALAVFTLDAQGNVTGVHVTFTDTPNLTGTAAFLCPRLAA